MFNLVVALPGCAQTTDGTLDVQAGTPLTPKSFAIGDASGDTATFN